MLSAPALVAAARTIAAAMSAAPVTRLIVMLPPRAIVRTARPAMQLLVAGSHDPRLVGEHDRLDAVAQAQLAEDARDVALDGRFAEKQLAGDLGVRHPARDQPQD